jgi:hypothetical protein
MDSTNGRPQRYRIVVRGRLSDRLGSALDGLELERRPGETVLKGSGDGARLTAVLERLDDLGLELVRLDVE